MNKSIIWKVGLLGGLGAGLYYIMHRTGTKVLYFDCKSGKLLEKDCNNHHNTHTYKFSVPITVVKIVGKLKVWQMAQGTTPVAIELSADGTHWNTIKIMQFKNEKITSFSITVPHIVAQYLRFRAVGSSTGIYKFGYIEYSSGAVYYV